MSTFAPPKTRDTSYWHDEFVAQQVEHNTFNVGVPGSSPGEFTSNRFLKRVGCFVFRLRLSGLSPSCHSAPRKRDSGTRSMMTHFVRHSSPGEFTSNRFLKRSRLFCFSASALRVISLVLFRTAQARRRHSVDDDALRATFEPRRVHQQPILEKESVVLFSGIGSSNSLKSLRSLRTLRTLKQKTGEPRKFSCFLVELPGFEPGTTEPKSAVLPLHHSSIRCSKAIAKVM